ncbi:cupin domain-containing protein [Promicromonospora sp. NPDC059942]|uniref:AraC family transcriptional regulator n=1 Tax=Promicromonospora sp. NPDC059942 TaxID=3347009 RepID=UPI00364CFEB5
MDPLSQLLAHPHAEGAFTLLMSMRAPWAVRVEDEAALTVVIVTSGGGLLEAGDVVHELRTGDVALVRGPLPYRVADAAGSATVAIIEPGQRCVTPDGAPLDLALAHGLRHWGNDADGPDRMIVASYADVGSVGRFVTEVLPDAAVVEAGALDPALVGHLAREIARDDLGQSVVLDRLVDVVTIESIRAWTAAHPPTTPSWLGGVGDPVVSAALRAMHAEPERAWTVADLARRAAVSRATLAARFTERVGTPPLRYLTSWRLALARDLLVDRSLTLDAVAQRVGYSSGFALSTAFTRAFDVSPAAYRRRLAEGPRLIGAAAKVTERTTGRG